MGCFNFEEQVPILQRKSNQLQSNLSDFRIKNNLLEPLKREV